MDREEKELDDFDLGLKRLHLFVLITLMIEDTLCSPSVPQFLLF